MQRRSLLLGAALAGVAHLDAWTQPAPAYRVHGFRSATFGLREAEVRAAIARDFPAAAAAVRHVDNPAEGTTALVLPLPALEPGPGPARVSYVFGASSQRLIHVSVVWQSDGAIDAGGRARYAAAGSQLAAYFRALPWGPKASAVPSPAGPNGLVLFVGIDEAGAGVEVRVLGVGTVDPQGRAGPEPAGPAQLRVAYHANVGAPDIRVTARA